MMFHVIMFVSLIAAIKLYPWFLSYAVKYFPTNEIMAAVVAYVGVYIAAAFIIPEVIAMIWRMTMEN